MPEHFLQITPSFSLLFLKSCLQDSSSGNLCSNFIKLISLIISTKIYDDYITYLCTGKLKVRQNNNNINTITFTVIERFVKHRNKYLIKDNCKCRDTWELLYVSNFNDSIIFSKNEAYTITDALPTIENCAIKWHTENIFTYSIAAEHKDTLGNLGPNLNAIVYTFDNNYAVKELVFFNSFLQNSPGIYCLTMQDGTTINAYNSFGFSSDNSTRIEVVEGCD